MLANITLDDFFTSTVFFITLGKLTPSPIRRELAPILELLETEAVKNLKHPNGKHINIDNLYNAGDQDSAPAAF